MTHKTHHEDVGVLVVGWDAPAIVKKLDARFWVVSFCLVVELQWQSVLFLCLMLNLLEFVHWKLKKNHTEVSSFLFCCFHDFYRFCAFVWLFAEEKVISAWYVWPQDRSSATFGCATMNSDESQMFLRMLNDKQLKSSKVWWATGRSVNQQMNQKMVSLKNHWK